MTPLSDVECDGRFVDDPNVGNWLVLSTVDREQQRQLSSGWMDGRGNVSNGNHLDILQPNWDRDLIECVVRDLMQRRVE
jgi:hypothetical protein